MLASALNTFRKSATRELEQRFGWSNFRPGQLEVLEALHEHHAALALFPTGGGKSLCYQLYAQLAPTGLTIVVSPLIALMKDQVDDMKARGIAAARLDSSIAWPELRQIRDDLRTGALRLLYVAPERFNNERFRELIEGLEVALFAVDEAHCISQWGHNFRPDYLKLVGYARRLKARALLALTATATPSVVHDIRRALEIPGAACIITSAYRPNLFLEVTPLPVEERTATLVDRLLQRPPGTTIVYVTLQKQAERVASELSQAGLPARAYHAGLKPDQRSEIQEQWMREPDRIVVATIAFGMGIDKRDVRYIYHHDLPKSLEGYVQEIGRAGRDGEPSRVEIFGNPDDVETLAAFTLDDTPAAASLASLGTALLAHTEPFGVSRYHLAKAHGIRPLVLATALTYLELLGILEQGTPSYGAYRITAPGGPSALLKRLSGTTQTFYRELLATGSGRIHTTIDIDTACAKTGRDRAQIMRSIQYLERERLAEIRPSKLELRYRPLAHDFTPASLTEELTRRFRDRERQDLDRLDKVVEYIGVDACKTAFLLHYFGEGKPSDCGHCSWCAAK